MKLQRINGINLTLLTVLQKLTSVTLVCIVKCCISQHTATTIHVLDSTSIMRACVFTSHHGSHGDLGSVQTHSVIRFIANVGMGGQGTRSVPTSNISKESTTSGIQPAELEQKMSGISESLTHARHGPCHIMPELCIRAMGSHPKGQEGDYSVIQNLRPQ